MPPASPVSNSGTGAVEADDDALAVDLDVRHGGAVEQIAIGGFAGAQFPFPLTHEDGAIGKGFFQRGNLDRFRVEWGAGADLPGVASVFAQRAQPRNHETGGEQRCGRVPRAENRPHQDGRSGKRTSSQ